MNSKAFTLFTALISFVLITLAFVLVQSMIESERNSSQTIETIDEQIEMQNIADLARADALQLFNVGVRYQFERWITDSSNEFYVMDRDAAENWDMMVEDFARAELGGKEITDAHGTTTTATRQFSSAMARYMVGIVSRGSGTYAFKGYDVYLLINEDNPSDTTKFEQVLQDITVNGIDRGTLLEPIECNSSECKIGTFYINLDLTTLSNEEYQQLPQIIVKSQATGRIIKQPILPKGNIRIFVPLRIFKALWKSKEIANSEVFTLSEGLRNIGVGMCDSDCSIRVNPEAHGIPINKQNFPGTEGKGALCPGTAGEGSINQLSEVRMQCSPPDACPATYIANNSASMANALREFITKKGSDAFDFENPRLLDPEPEDGLVLWPEGIPPGSVIKGGTKTNAEAKEIIYVVSGNAMQLRGSATCVSFSGLDVILVFDETRPEYKVNQARGDDKVYKIKISDYPEASPNAPKAQCYSVENLGSSMGSVEYSCSESP